MLRVKSKVWLEQEGELVFGTGRAVMLRAVAETGSLNRAAAKLGMSFRRLWSYLNVIEKRLGRPLLVKNKGGKGGGGANLTPFAEQLLTRFEKLERSVAAHTDRRFKEIFP